MKNRICLIALVLIGCLISSCESDDTDNLTEFEKSQTALFNFKKQTNNSYKYTVVSSIWIGIAWETTIVVSNGQVVIRSFKYTNTKGLRSDIPKDELEWMEYRFSIGSHENVAAPALTLDQIYTKAEQEWLLKREDSKTFFETQNNGLISTCGYVENGCADDCFRGIHIKNIEGLDPLLLF